MSKLRKRNKLINVADRSPEGWATVREYKKPSLCGRDSEDDRKLEQTETRALKNIKLSKSSSPAQSDNVPDQGYSFFMPPDGLRPGTSFQFPVEPSWGRGRGTFPICRERQSAATDNLKRKFVENDSQLRQTI